MVDQGFLGASLGDKGGGDKGFGEGGASLTPRGAG